MTKSQCITEFANKFNVTRAQAEEMFQFPLNYMYDTAMQEGSCVFGAHKMARKETASRMGRNPQTGEQIKIPAKVKVAYKRLNR